MALKDLLAQVQEELLEDRALSLLGDEDLMAYLRDKVEQEAAQEGYVSLRERIRRVNALYAALRGYGPLDPLLRDEAVTEIMVNGFQDIFVEKAGRIHRVDSQFASSKQLEDVIQKIVSQVGREVNEAAPIVDTRLKDGSRVNVVLPPIALNGALLTIRKFSRSPMTMEKLLAFGALDQEVASFLKRLVQAKYNIVISGGTGSGKTTFLNALSQFIPTHERIITIEDSAELQIASIDNLVRLEARNANTANKGAISIRDLIKTSLRMRPERIIVGEVRGFEALDMLQAMNTGHDGSLSTAHANSAQDLLSRLETMVLMGHVDLPLLAIRSQIASALDIVVQLSRMRDGSRKVVEIVEVLGLEKGAYQLNPLFVFEEDEASRLDRVSGHLVPSRRGLIQKGKLRASGLLLDHQEEREIREDPRREEKEDV